jgi:Hepatitis C virus NS3 protease
MKLPLEEHPVYALRLDGQWIRGRAGHMGCTLWLKELKPQGGMSGSPILNERGEAIGVCSVIAHRRSSSPLIVPAGAKVLSVVGDNPPHQGVRSVGVSMFAAR